MDDVLADVCENELRRFDDIRAHRAERQALDIALGDFRQSPSARFERHFEAGGIVEAHRRRRRSRPGVQHEPLGLRLTGERDAEQIAHLTLVPTERRTDVGDAGNRAVRRAAPDNETLVAGLAGDVTQLDPFRHVPPSVRERGRPPRRSNAPTSVGRFFGAIVNGSSGIAFAALRRQNARSQSDSSKRRTATTRPRTRSAISAAHIGPTHHALSRRAIGGSAGDP